MGADLFAILQGEVDSLTSATPASNVAEAREPEVEAKAKKTPSKASPSSSKKKSAALKKAASQAKTKNKKIQEKTSSASSSSRPMQWPYTEMYKIDAIAQIMRENAGNSVHIDDLIVQLYGELSGDDLKVERDRVYKTMQSGV